MPLIYLNALSFLSVLVAMVKHHLQTTNCCRKIAVEYGTHFLVPKGVTVQAYARTEELGELLPATLQPVYNAKMKESIPNRSYNCVYQR